MNISSVFRLVLITGALGYILLHPKAYATGSPSGGAGSSSVNLLYEVSGDTVSLSKQKVKDWIQSRIAVARLQEQMKANAADYDDVVQSFYTRRATLLKLQGWTVEEFDIMKERVRAAVTAMEMADELEESRADHEEEIAEIQANDFFTEEQKKEMIEALHSMREEKRAQFIEPTKPDWSAVQPYRSELEELTAWIAGNTLHPPEIE